MNAKLLHQLPEKGRVKKRPQLTALETVHLSEKRRLKKREKRKVGDGTLKTAKQTISNAFADTVVMPKCCIHFVHLPSPTFAFRLFSIVPFQAAVQSPELSVAVSFSLVPFQAVDLVV